MRAILKEMQFRLRGAKTLRCYGRIETAFGKKANVRSFGTSTVGNRLIGATPRNTSTIVKLGDNSTLVLNNSIIGRGVAIVCLANASVEIGAGSYVTDTSKILSSRSITIGCRCAVSWNVTFMDDDGHGRERSAPIVIEDDVWIGCNAMILKGVTIGKGSVIAAGAVVTRSCAPRSLVAGIPAKTIKDQICWQS